MEVMTSNDISNGYKKEVNYQDFLSSSGDHIHSAEETSPSFSHIESTEMSVDEEIN